MKLTNAQTEQLYREGYVKLPGAAPQKLLNIALRSINHSVGQGIDPDEISTLRATSYCPELRYDPAITNLLYKTSVWEAAESLCGEGNLKLMGGGQIALRFPVMEKPTPLHPHLDGMFTATNKLQKGTLESFTMLAAIFLSNVPNEYWGNFTVWPGTHWQIAQFLKSNGLDSLRAGLPAIEMPEPRQVLAQAGDALICHYELVHTVVSNVSPYIRYAIFFRLIHREHRNDQERALTDLWHEWPGMQVTVGDRE